ncbi:MAG: choice-of-anchor W domain-containing protein [Planctomycetota bacterium]
MFKPAVAALAVSAFALPAFAAGIHTEQVASDSDMNAMILSKPWVVEGRFGNNNANNGDWEQGIWDPNSVADQDNFSWVSGNAVDFTLAFTAGTNLVEFTLSDTAQQLTRTVMSFEEDGFNTLFLRTRATRDNSSILLDELVLDGMDVGDTSFASGDDDGLGILKIAMDGLDDGFILTGQATMIWSDPTPRGSHLAFQIKATETEMNVIPTPTAAAAGILGIATLCLRRRRA